MPKTQGIKEGDDGWPTAEISPLVKQNQRYQEAFNGTASARDHAHLANAFRDDYLAFGKETDREQALAHYREADIKAGEAGDHLLDAWILYSRLKLGLDDHAAGTLPAERVLEDLEDIEAALSMSRDLRDRGYRRAMLGHVWRIQSCFARLERVDPQPGEESRVPILRLVGGTALDGLATGPTPEPEAA